MQKSKIVMIAVIAIILTAKSGYASTKLNENERDVSSQALNFVEIANPFSILTRAMAGAPSLERAVAKAALAAKAKQVAERYGTVTRPVVEPHRSSADGSWVFGGVYFPIPSNVTDAAPVTTLFIAYKGSDNRWTVIFEGTEEFEIGVSQAPEDVVTGPERQLFAARSASRLRLQSLQDVGLSLPFQLNGAAWGHSGVHGDTGSSRPYNAIDFWGGDGRVLASRGGIAYKYCTSSSWPYIEIVHNNGWTTGYYHTKNQAAIANGQQVNEGDFIGMIGVELPCGGRASGDHVHWTLWSGNSGAAEAVNNKTIGGWTWYEGSQAYSGYAERNGVRVNTGRSGLVNYGHSNSSTPTPPPTTEPCSGTGCNKYTGSFSASGQRAFHPNSSGFQFNGGTLKAWLRGPDGTDFNLILGRYNSSTGQWDRVASSNGPTSEETVTYNATSGYYRWRVNANSGVGSYTLWTQQ